VNGKRILVVDDSPIELRLTTRMLSQAGYETVTALTGEQALRFAMEVRVDLVLLDIHMPEMDGFEVCRRLKENPTTTHVPVILYSIRDQLQDVLRGEEVGADDFVAKSAGSERLLGSMERLLGRAGGSEPAECRFDLKPLEQAAARFSPADFAREIAEPFFRLVHPALESVLGAQPAEMLLALAVRKVSHRFPFFAASSQATLFDSERLAKASLAEILRGIQHLVTTLDALMSKIAHAGVYTTGHLKEITSADAEKVTSALRAFTHQVQEITHAKGIEAKQEKPVTEGTAAPTASATLSGEDPSARESARTFKVHLEGSGVIVNCEASAREILGYDTMGLRGVPFTTLIDNRSHPAFASLLAAAKATGRGDAELIFKNHQGEPMTGQMSLIALYDALGQFVIAEGCVQIGSGG
jgi:CheY-like chemotaxis protein